MLQRKGTEFVGPKPRSVAMTIICVLPDGLHITSLSLMIPMMAFHDKEGMQYFFPLDHVTEGHTVTESQSRSLTVGHPAPQFPVFDQSTLPDSGNILDQRFQGAT